MGDSGAFGPSPVGLGSHLAAAPLTRRDTPIYEGAWNTPSKTEWGTLSGSKTDKVQQRSRRNLRLFEVPSNDIHLRKRLFERKTSRSLADFFMAVPGPPHGPVPMGPPWPNLGATWPQEETWERASRIEHHELSGVNQFENCGFSLVVVKL